MRKVGEEGAVLWLDEEGMNIEWGMARGAWWGADSRISWRSWSLQAGEEWFWRCNIAWYGVWKCSSNAFESA